MKKILDKINKNTYLTFGLLLPNVYNLVKSIIDVYDWSKPLIQIIRQLNFNFLDFFVQIIIVIILYNLISYIKRLESDIELLKTDTIKKMQANSLIAKLLFRIEADRYIPVRQTPQGTIIVDKVQEEKNSLINKIINENPKLNLEYVRKIVNEFYDYKIE